MAAWPGWGSNSMQRLRSPLRQVRAEAANGKPKTDPSQAIRRQELADLPVGDGVDEL
jgi:hypothetical protein